MRGFFFLVVALLLVSCFDKGDCLYTNTNQVKVLIKDAGARSKSKSLTFSSIHIPETGTLYEAATGSSFTLLVDPRVNQTEFVLKTGTRSDTIVLGYSSRTRVLNPDCGAVTYHDGLEVLETTFSEDNVVITNPQLLISVKSNIELYY